MEWEYEKYDEKLATDLGAYLGVSPILGALLLERGYSDPLRANLFLRPKLANLDDPFRLKNLRQAVLRVIEAINKKHNLSGKRVEALRVGAGICCAAPNGGGLRPKQGCA